MSKDWPIAQYEIKGATYSDPQIPIPPHVGDVPGIGQVHFLPGDAISIGRIGSDDTAERLALFIAAGPCGCGCGRPAMGFFVTPAPAEGRKLAAQLIAIAERLETAAESAAADAINRASNAQ